MAYSDLSMQEKAQVIRMGVRAGLKSLKDIQSFYDSNVQSVETEPLDEFAEGGSIHIKHPGRLTALKERTGKSEAELWATGNAHTRKMITFARNAAHWHGDGGDEKYEPWWPDDHKERYGLNIGAWLAPQDTREYDLGNARNPHQATEYLLQNSTGFVQDYQNRLRKQHPELSEKNISDLVSYLSPDNIFWSANLPKNVLGRTVFYPENSHRIELNEDIGQFSRTGHSVPDTFRHEAHHLFRNAQNEVLGLSPNTTQYSDLERILLENAYGGISSALEKERGAVNTELRSLISRNNNNIWGEQLNEVIDNLSDSQLLEYINKMHSGYIPTISTGNMERTSEWYVAPDQKRKEELEIELNETLPRKVFEVMNRIAPQYLSPKEDGTYLDDDPVLLEGKTWDDYMKAVDQDEEYQQLQQQRRKTYESLHNTIVSPDTEKMKAVRTALKEVAQNAQPSNQSNGVYLAAQGGSIHINPKNRGKFNATKAHTGKTTEELTHSKNPLTRKRAIFARNARKWKHDLGGMLFGEGGGIHIAPSKKGTFTAAATKHGKSVQAFASQVLAHKENYSPAMVRKANFARNSARWHADGGSNWLPDFAYNPSIQSDNGRQLVQSVLQDENIQRAVRQKALQRQAEREAQRKAVSEIYNGMPNPGAGYVSGTDPLLQAVVDMTPAGDAEMATEAASELRNWNLKEAGLLGAALLLPNIFNKGIKEWRAARALKNSERGLVYTTRNNLTKYNPNLNEETVQALQQAERDYNNGLFTLEHQSELDPIFELGLHTPAGKTAYPEGVEVWYRGLSKSKGKQVGITPEEFEEMWDKNVAAGNYSNLFFGDLNSARSYISGQTNPLEYARITGRNFPKGDDSKLLQLVFPKGKAVEIDANRAVWSDLSRIPFGKLSSKEEEMLKKASVAYDTEIKKRKLLQQRLDNYYKKHPEMLQSNSQSKWLQELQSKIDNSFYKVSDAHRKFMSLYKKKYPFSKTKDVSDYLTHSNFSGVTLHNIQDYGPSLYLYGTPGSISIRKPVSGNYGKSTIASNFKFDLNDPSIWAFGGNLKSTGGPLYPFSFTKRRIPSVRY